MPRIYRSAIIISKNNIPIALSLSFSYPRTDPNQPGINLKIIKPHDIILLTKWKNRTKFGYLEVELGKNMTVVNKSLKFDLPNNNTDARVDMKNGEIEVEVKENQTTFSDVIDILINALAITMQYVMFMPKPLLIYNETEKRLEEKITDEMPVSIRNSKLLDLMGFNDLLDLNVLFNLNENNLSICSCINNRRWFNFSSQIMEDDQTSIGFKTKYENNFLTKTTISDDGKIRKHKRYLARKNIAGSSGKTSDLTVACPPESINLSQINLSNYPNTDLYKPTRLSETETKNGYQKLSDRSSNKNFKTSSKACVLL